MGNAGENPYSYTDIEGWGPAYALYRQIVWANRHGLDSIRFTEDPILGMVFSEQTEFLRQRPLMWISDFTRPDYLMSAAQAEVRELAEAFEQGLDAMSVADEAVDVYVFAAMALGMHGAHLTEDELIKVDDLLAQTRDLLERGNIQISLADVRRVILEKNGQNCLPEFFGFRDPGKDSVEQALEQFGLAVMWSRGMRINLPDRKLPSLLGDIGDSRKPIQILPGEGVIFDAEAEAAAARGDGRWDLYPVEWRPVV